MINLRFKPRSDGSYRVVGYTTVPYSTSNEEEQIAETSQDEIANVFEDADVDELEGTGESIEAAIEEPLRFRDFLVLEGGEIAFDDEYVREYGGEE